MNQKKNSIINIAIGPVFDKFGGVSQHIFGIQKYSSHDIRVFPSKFSRTIMGKSELRRSFYQSYKNRTLLSEYDIVHSHVDPWFIDLCSLSRTSKCKWVHTYHTLYFKEDYPEGLQSWQEKINRYLIDVASKADLRISISKWLHDYLIDNYSIQTEIIPNGVDLKACGHANAQRFVKKYDLQNFVLFVGNLQPIKNPKFFVELASQMPDIRFVMIGRDIDSASISKKYRISIPKNLILMNEMKHEDVLDAISACKVFTMTSKREGIPTVLLEAMGMGKPVVAPNHSGCKEVICSNEYGFLYEPDLIDDFVEKTKQALISKYAGEKAKERVSNFYDWKILDKRIDSIYESLM